LGRPAFAGAGSFQYDPGTQVLPRAEPDSLFVFAGWWRSVFSWWNPLTLAMENDHKVRAQFISVLDVLYVNDDASNDPGRGDPNLSDPNENGTSEHPFDTIQEAIDVAKEGAKVMVRTGTYRESIDLLGKSITVSGLDDDPNNGAIAEPPVIDAQGRDAVVKCTHREDANSILQGLVITGGKAQMAGAILCVGSSPTVLNCLIVGNRASDENGATIRCTDSSATFFNCTITDNQAGALGAALYLQNSPVTVVNSILWGNAPREIQSDGVKEPVIRYCTVCGGWPGPGNLAADPLFATAGQWVSRSDPMMAAGPNDPCAVWITGDYHLQSQIGRWESKTGKWLQDQATSPCIDGGDPAAGVGAEPLPNGGIINMGAYGGTAEASKSYSDAPVHFNDAHLKAVVEEALWISDPTPEDMIGLTSLAAEARDISDLTGLEYATNLEYLWIRWNQISDLSPLSGLTKLKFLDGHGNESIRDISPLAGLTDLDTLILRFSRIRDISVVCGLTNLAYLHLEWNDVSDASPLQSLRNLRGVNLQYNKISDISPLSSLTSLEYVDLRDNPLNPSACAIYIPQIVANNPGVDMKYNSCVRHGVVFSSTEGGRITAPGEGEFLYDNGEIVLLNAQADPGFVFVSFSGTLYTTDNPVHLCIEQDHQICANFRPITDQHYP
jgi:Leucine-rich repeat (LRR) protein